nr:ribonuclease H-like domain-containing protein [Tanacetum cinerariifolium]
MSKYHYDFQFGVGVSSGAEAVLHSVNRLLSEYHNDGSLTILIIDFSYAFNLMDRSAGESQVSTANLSDATVYAFLANQPNGSQLVHEDLEQIREDDLEEMDLKWQLALLSMRAKRFFQKTSKKITINGSDTAGYDKAKVECFNCHKIWHFTRECRVPRNQENKTRNQETTRRTMNVENTTSKAMVAIDEAEFAEPSVEIYGVKPIKVVTLTSSVKIYKPVKENNDAPLIEDWESKGEDEVESPPEIERKTVKPSVDKIEIDIP